VVEEWEDCLRLRVGEAAGSVGGERGGCSGTATAEAIMVVRASCARC
jgi:hypothetical protein